MEGLAIRPAKGYRVVLLGSVAVGKTALATQFACGTFPETCEPSVEDLFSKVIEVNAAPALLEIVDTVGAEHLVTLKDLYIRNSDGFVVLYSVSSEASFAAVRPLRARMGWAGPAELFSDSGCDKLGHKKANCCSPSLCVLLRAGSREKSPVTKVSKGKGQQQCGKIKCGGDHRAHGAAAGKEHSSPRPSSVTEAPSGCAQLREMLRPPVSTLQSPRRDPSEESTVSTLFRFSPQV
ncbi:PREDICTED: uncharacterized protein LOC105983120 [Dipodomys ordii]|uniref:Uncharacterized protein LOC105983120 n=1 Tax=Dipodomys ordii TaxID=10020 RepID=A0A1S3EY35_DIPOR|nr:PREDICTED: uncharacterized protein LOC105983120 [Dipodomys ordii]